MCCVRWLLANMSRVQTEQINRPVAKVNTCIEQEAERQACDALLDENCREGGGFLTKAQSTQDGEGLQVGQPVMANPSRIAFANVTDRRQPSNRQFRGNAELR